MDPTRIKVPGIYIKFVAPYLPQNKKSKTPISKSLTPSWESLEFRVTVPEKEYIESHHILCVVMLDVSIGPNILIGQGILGLREACSGAPLLFQIPVYDRGIEVGNISGSVQLTDLVSVKQILRTLDLKQEVERENTNNIENPKIVITENHVNT